MPRVSEEYYEKKRREIIDATFRVCLKKPLSSIEMKDIIAETGYSHGAIYRYYNNLDEVLHDVVITINSENRIDEKIEEIMKSNREKKWETKIYKLFDVLSEQMESVGIDLLKITIYCDNLAMNDPERAKTIAKNIGKEEQSPIGYMINALALYLTEVIKENKLKPSRSIDEILQFVLIGYNGAVSGYVLSQCFDVEQLEGKYKPSVMLSCLADSVISMVKGV